MDANTLSAKIIKAEILGDMDRVADLKKQLDQINNDQKQSHNSNKHNRRDINNRNSNHHHHNQRQEKETTDQLNKLNAKMIKAEMMGNQDLVKELKLQLEQLKKLSHSRNTNSHPSRPSNNNKPLVKGDSASLNQLTAQLMKAEMMGDLQRVSEIKKLLGFSDVEDNEDDDDMIERNQSGSTSSININEPSRNSNKLNQIAKKISQDRLGLKQMFVSAKGGDVEDEARLFIASSSKLINMDDEYEEVVRKGHKKRRLGEKEDRLVVANLDKPEETECGHCVQKVPKRLVIEEKSTIYLCLPQYEPFVDGHCFIRSINHVRCSVEAEEDCLTEILDLRKQLCQLAAGQKKVMIFTEMYMKKGRNTHFQIECFPIKRRYMADCKMYFKKAILECEMEWSMNKKLIEMKEKCITKSIPKGLSYFWVSFGSSNDSYGHVIEEERYFPKHFGHEVLSGLLDIDRFKYTRPRIESYEDQVKRSNQFRTDWNQLNREPVNQDTTPSEELIPIMESKPS